MRFHVLILMTIPNTGMIVVLSSIVSGVEVSVIGPPVTLSTSCIAVEPSTANVVELSATVSSVKFPA